MENRGLIFRFKDFIDECETLKAYASEVLDEQTTWVLDVAKSTLENIQDQGPTDRATRWTISKEHPLSTIWSNRESKPGAKSEHKIQASLSFVWEIRPLPERKTKRKSCFLLDGLASTQIKVIEEGSHPLAQWTVEVGDHQSPGTHFHFQINGSLDVPRLPAPVMSPFLAMEFVIGEIFQDRWKKLAAEESKHARRWHSLHKERLERFFEWQKQCVERCSGSPWMALKLAKPQSNLFVDRI